MTSRKLLICVSALARLPPRTGGARQPIAAARAVRARRATGLAAFQRVPRAALERAGVHDGRRGRGGLSLRNAAAQPTGRDRAQMVARKLRQHYRNTPYIGAWLQGRETDKRRDDRYLFSALTNPGSRRRLAAHRRAQELPLAGVYLLPMVSVGLLEKLQVKTPNLLSRPSTRRAAAHVLPRPAVPSEPPHARRQRQERRTRAAFRRAKSRTRGSTCTRCAPRRWTST